uniref:Uncharacterized protein n=1 Tax=Neobodo designis TaxID=312471 RepID=A0A7S1MEV0_NEODS|mmetsp:Transcript_39169/g.121058  ORF Transcript_39169/g.121058 Transcript_39169/m.121058 type:complete len:116 (+) Transcript_39169:99-446(+)
MPSTRTSTGHHATVDAPCRAAGTRAVPSKGDVQRPANRPISGAAAALWQPENMPLKPTNPSVSTTRADASASDSSLRTSTLWDSPRSPTTVQAASTGRKFYTANGFFERKDSGAT